MRDEPIAFWEINPMAQPVRRRDKAKSQQLFSGPITNTGGVADASKHRAFESDRNICQGYDLVNYETKFLAKRLTHLISASDGVNSSANAFPISGFVHCAADDTAPFRLARMPQVGSNLQILWYPATLREAMTE
jgi:hypothetical protein